ncbi:hypothetical protein D3C75_314570 [compost metagenome]
MKKSFESLYEYVEDKKCREYLDAILTASAMLDYKVYIKCSTSFIDLDIEKGRVPSMGFEKSLNFSFSIDSRKKYLKSIEVVYTYIIHTEEKYRGPHTPFMYYKDKKIKSKFDYDFTDIFEKAYEIFIKL